MAESTKSNMTGHNNSGNSSVAQNDSKNETESPGTVSGDEEAQVPRQEMPESKPRSKMQTALIMSSICMAVFLAAIDTVILTTALPTIATDFNASDSGFAWIGSAFLIANGTSMPFWGTISSIFGRKPIIIIANIVFMVGSLIAALSKNINMLLAGRVIQGIGAGGLMVLANIVVSDLFSMRDRSLYLALIGMVWAFATAIGPVIGGAFAETIGWRWCFWINLPCDGLALTLLVLFLKVHNPRTPLIAGLKAMDWLGALTIVGGTVMFLLGLQFGGVVFPWTSATVLCLIIFGLITLGIFVLVQWKVAKSPLIPLHIFKTLPNVSILIVNISHGFCYITGCYYIPVYFQTALGATPIQSGVWFLAMAGVMAFAIIIPGIYIQRTGRYLDVIRFGLFFMTLSFGLFIDFQPYRSWPRIIIYQMIFALGIGPLFQSPLIAFQATLQPKDIATGTSTYGFVRMLSTSVSIVVGQVIFQSEMARKLPALLAAGISSDLASTLAKGNVVSATSIIGDLSKSQKYVVSKSITDSFDKMWIFYVVLAFVGLVASFGIKKRELSKKHVEMKTGLKTETQGGDEQVKMES